MAGAQRAAALERAVARAQGAVRGRARVRGPTTPTDGSDSRFVLCIYGAFQVRFGRSRVLNALEHVSRGFPEHSRSALASRLVSNHSQKPTRIAHRGLSLGRRVRTSQRRATTSRDLRVLIRSIQHTRKHVASVRELCAFARLCAEGPHTPQILSVCVPKKKKRGARSRDRISRCARTGSCRARRRRRSAAAAVAAGTWLPARRRWIQTRPKSTGPWAWARRRATRPSPRPARPRPATADRAPPDWTTRGRRRDF